MTASRTPLLDRIAQAQGKLAVNTSTGLTRDERNELDMLEAMAAYGSVTPQDRRRMAELRGKLAK